MVCETEVGQVVNDAGKCFSLIDEVLVYIGVDDSDKVVNKAAFIYMYACMLKQFRCL